MKDTPQDYKLAYSLILFVGILLFGTPSFASIETTKQQFESCVAQQVTRERTRNAPKVANVLSACETEYAAFLQSLPRGTSNDARQITIRHIKKQLKK